MEAVKQLFNRTTISIVISSIISFIIGLIMVINPNLSLETIGIIVGIYIIVHGVALIILDIKASMYYVPFDGIMSGILSIVIGSLLLAMPKLLATILTIALGIWVIISSVNAIKMVLAIRKEEPNWIIILLLGILDIIAGLVILFNPFASSLSIAMIAGIIIMVHSVINVFDMLVIKKNVKTISKAIESSIKEVK